MSRHRSWALTYFGDQEKGKAHFKEFVENIARYGIFGCEVCPDTKREHLQAYIMLENGRTFRSMQKSFDGWHLEVCKGNHEDNVAYCMKEGAYWAHGEAPKQGKRSDLERVREMVKSGNGMREIVEEVGSFQAMRGAELMMKYVEAKRDWKTKVIWVFGDSGSGKSRWAFENYPDAWVSAGSLQWWDGYDCHEHVILDDFRDNQVGWTELLRILDRYPFRVQTKGGSRQLLAKVIVITSIKRPEVCYRGVDEDKIQLLRRIDTIIWMKDGTGTEVRGNTGDPDLFKDFY